MSILQG